MTKLQEEVKSLRERHQKKQEERVAVAAEEAAKIVELRTALKAKEEEVEQLKMFRAEAKKLTDSQKLLEGWVESFTGRSWDFIKMEINI